MTFEADLFTNGDVKTPSIHSDNIPTDRSIFSLCDSHISNHFGALQARVSCSVFMKLFYKCDDLQTEILQSFDLSSSEDCKN